MLNSLIENSLDFIISASYDLANDELSEENQVKYSTIKLYEGIELLLKARLMKEHWSLILRNIDKHKKGDFELGNFISVNFEISIKRLKDYCEYEIAEDARKSFDELRKLRNRYVHFSCDESRNFVIVRQLRAWHFILKMMSDKFLEDITEKHQEMLEDARNRMLKSKEFLDKRYIIIKPEIDKLIEDSIVSALTCPYCENESLIIGDGYPFCKVCEYESESFEDAAETYAIFIDPMWNHPRHGVDNKIPFCRCWGNQTVAPLNDDFTEFICFECAEFAEEKDIHECYSCGEKYLDFNKEHLCPVCNR